MAIVGAAAGDAAALWSAVEEVAPRSIVLDAIAVVEELVPEDDGSAEAAMRTALAGRYNMVRPLLTLLGESPPLRAAPGGERVLTSVQSLPELARRRVGQKPLTAGEIDAELVTPAWRGAVYGKPGPAARRGGPGRVCSVRARAAASRVGSP